MWEPIRKIAKTKKGGGSGGMAQVVVERLRRKHKALSSNPNITQNVKKKKNLVQWEPKALDT
jgi:hypothetical protein